MYFWNGNNYCFKNDNFPWHTVLAEIKKRGMMFNYYIKVESIKHVVSPVKLPNPIQGKVSSIEKAKQIIEEYYSNGKNNIS